MIGMVLAAGASRRLRPDTDALPKALLPVAGDTTILDIALRNLAAVGLREVVVVVGHAAEVISDRAADLQRRHGVTLRILAVDDVKQLADEEMKITLDSRRLLARISKQLDPDQAYGEYIGATLISPVAAEPLTSALAATWRRDPGLYYEDGYQELADRGGEVAVAPIGAVEWVEVDNHDDLRRAREIAIRC